MLHTAYQLRLPGIDDLIYVSVRLFKNGTGNGRLCLLKTWNV